MINYVYFKTALKPPVLWYERGTTLYINLSTKKAPFTTLIPYSPDCNYNLENKGIVFKARWFVQLDINTGVTII